MIDTIKFQIPLVLVPTMTLTENGFSEFSKSSGLYRNTSYTKGMCIGAFGYAVRVWIPKRVDQSNMYLEFSLPKLLFGTNVLLFPPSLLIQSVMFVKEKVEKENGLTLPPIQDWKLQRLDICYTWKFKSEYVALQILELLKRYGYPRKNRVIHDTSLKYGGWTYKLQFYKKRDEFLQSKDYKNLVAFSSGYAKYLNDLSLGTLRFELQLFRKKIQDLFGQNPPLSMFADTRLLEKTLSDHLETLIGDRSIKVIDSFQVMKQLQEVYSIKQSLRLFQFFSTYTTSESAKNVLKKGYTQSTLIRNLKDIRKAGVSLSSNTISLHSSFSIPSQFAVSQPTADTASAVTQGLNKHSQVLKDVMNMQPEDDFESQVWSAVSE